MKPLIKYWGGKTKKIPLQIRHIPQFSGRYIESFFCGGALFFSINHEMPLSMIITLNSWLYCEKNNTTMEKEKKTLLSVQGIE